MSHNVEQAAAGGWLAIAAIVLVAIDLRPAIVSIGPILTNIREEFGLPLSVGAIRDLSQDFRPSAWLPVAVAAAMLGLTPFLRPHHHRG